MSSLERVNVIKKMQHCIDIVGDNWNDEMGMQLKNVMTGILEQCNKSDKVMQDACARKDEVRNLCLQLDSYCEQSNASSDKCIGEKIKSIF